MLNDRITLVAFDAVGTLLFPEPGAPDVYYHVARSFGATSTAATIRERMITAYNVEETFDEANNWRTSEERERDRWQTIVTHALADVPDPKSCFAALFEHFARPESWRVHADALETFHRLRAQGLQLALASNYDARLHRVVMGHPVLQSLQPNIIISSEMGVRKPHAEFFTKMAQQCGVHDLTRIAYIGDDLQNDFHGAEAAGLQAILFDPASRRPEIPRRITRFLDLFPE